MTEDVADHLQRGTFVDLTCGVAVAKRMAADPVEREPCHTRVLHYDVPDRGG